MTGESKTTEATTAATTWQHLDDLIDELVSLVHQDLAPRDFWRQLLDRTVRALAAPGGAIWERRPDGQFALQCQLHSERSPWEGSADIVRRHARLLAHVGETRLALSLPPHSGSPASAGSDNPTSLLLLLSPVVSDDKVLAIVEILQRPAEAPTAPEGYLRFLSAVCELAADYERQRQLHVLRDSAGAHDRFANFTQSLHGSLDVRRVAYTLSNEGRTLIDCDRASVAVMHGRRARLQSVSGIDTLNRRGASVRGLERLIDAVVRIDEPLWYPADATALPPQIERVLQTYLDESHARQLAVIPLRRPAAKDSPESAGVVIGALVCESFTAPRSTDESHASMTAVAAQGRIALANALQFESVPLARLWRGLGGVGLSRGRQWLKAMLAVAVVAAAVAALVFVQIEYTVAARGELLPERRRDIFAPVDGIIADIRVAHGDTVAEGQTLLVLRRPQLELERTRVVGEQQTARKRLAALQATRFGGAAAAADARDQNHQRTADEEEIKEQLKSLTEQLELLDQQETELTIRSPLAGQVLTWDVTQLLAARPVERGRLLLSVGDAEGPWELEMRVDDDRMGHVLDAQRSAARPLNVSFLLAMTPDESFDAQLRDIAMTTDVIENAGPQVLVTATVDRTSLPRLRPGASVLAKIYCGRHSVGYVWLHDLWDAVRTRLFF